MSRVIKKVVVFLFLAVIFTGCGRDVFYTKNSFQQGKATVMQTARMDQEKDGILISRKADELNDKRQDLQESSGQIKTSEQSFGLEVNKISSSNPVDVVDGLLQSAGNGLRIAVVAPLTGKYSNIGNAVFDSALLKTNSSKYSIGTIKFYDINDLSSNDWQKNKEVQRLVGDDNDVIIGLFSTDVTKKLLSLIPDKMFISIINDEKIAKNYPNLTVLSMDDRFKIKSLFRYLEDTRRLFLSLILPATKKGYTTEKLFRDLAKDSNVTIVSSQFYQAKSRVSILASTRSISKALTVTFFVRDGKFITETYKDNLKKKKQQITEKDNEKKATVTTNAIYIDSDELDLITILDGLNKFNILDKNIQLFSSAMFIPENSDATKLDNVCYIGYNYNFVSDFNKKFNAHYGYQPNNVAYLTHDIISTLYYLANEGKMLPRKLYSESGFKGILDEFKFTRDGNVERRFGIYKLRDKNMFNVFMPSNYLSLELINDNTNYIDN